ncbi:three component ABC system middle component [Streptomyces sp. NRRL B-24484]|uniref:three component ABC system middle component n=1 Tax=Streptomyces sp. NRRL B-24484 TaxID=1463833 RepID=UPI0004BF3D1A|nr:three component ABC system middle component [Streptomyces sp. NRRL B-24484]
MPSRPVRPQAVAVYHNAALIAAVQATIARRYEADRGEPMVWPLATVLPVLVLHRSTRLALPRSAKTHLATWTARNPVLCAGFGPRVSAMLPAMREGLRFGMRHRLLRIEAGAVRGLIKPPRRGSEGELHDLLKAAAFVGHWAHTVDRPSTLLALLGVRP